MSLQIGRFTSYDRLAVAVSPVAGAASAVAAAPSPPVAGAGTPDAVFGDVPPVPTPEARAAVDRAADRVKELRAQSRELHFSRDESSNRVVIEVRDLDGNVIKTIPPSKAMDVMAGGKL